MDRSLAELDLPHLLIAAAEAPPNQRIEWRDRIAAHGAFAIPHLEPWLGDARLGAFAARTIARTVAFGARAEALAALKRGLTAAPERVRADIAAEIAALQPRSHPIPRGDETPEGPTADPSELVVGKRYLRKDLHDRGLGGNRRSGASYPARGTYVLLFSDPGARETYGYKDSWDGVDRYRFFGKWEGFGDMTMTGANAVIRDRSPELYLFTKFTDGYRYQGQFRVLRHDLERTERDGRSLEAIVFVLERARR